MLQHVRCCDRADASRIHVDDSRGRAQPREQRRILIGTDGIAHGRIEPVQCKRPGCAADGIHDKGLGEANHLRIVVHMCAGSAEDGAGGRVVDPDSDLGQDGHRTRVDAFDFIP